MSLDELRKEYMSVVKVAQNLPVDQISNHVVKAKELAGKIQEIERAVAFTSNPFGNYKNI